MTPPLQRDHEPTVLDKQPIKWMELPIRKFNEDAVPHHVNQLRTMKTNIQKFQKAADWPSVHREQLNANVVVRQLRTLIKEMDALRHRVIDADINKFDRMIDNSRQSALSILQEYIDLSQQLSNVVDERVNYDQNENNEGKTGSSSNFSDYDDNIQLQQTLEISKLAAECHQQERCALAWENLQKEIEEVHQLYEEFAKITQTQGENVSQIESNVDVAQIDVVEGEKSLMKAAHAKVAAYPFAGAVIGSFMGGPVGLIAGFKIGGLVALTCSILGFTGGKLLKEKQTTTAVSSSEIHQEKI